jgi:hypothetical protein
VGTCTWEPVVHNPFPNYITPFRIGLHLGIVMQILRILYEVEREGLSFEADCFLEHDVLYPHDYFDRVADALKENPDSVGAINLDDIGLNETGWLGVRSRHEPMHQISMRFEVAKRQFESVLRTCILNGSAMLEPDDKSAFARIPFADERSSCHINNSVHFTNHYDIYEKDSKGRIDHPYWGHFSAYYAAGEKSKQTV